jgi:uncharacterized protein YciI
MLSQGPKAAEAPAVGAHVSYLERLTASGVVLLAGRKLNSDARTFGMVTFAAESEIEAAEIVTVGPCVQRHLGVSCGKPYGSCPWKAAPKAFPLRVCPRSSKSRQSQTSGKQLGHIHP